MGKQYSLFISHSWKYSDAYDRLVALLNDAQYFPYRNYSVPRADPLLSPRTKAELRRAIKEQMAHANVVLVLAGVYATYSEWINEEIDLAKNGFENPKPIIAVAPWGAERISKFVRENADTMVGWNTNSIVDAIRTLSR